MRDWNEKRWKGPFLTIWSGQALSLLGSRLVQFALVWWMTETTGSETVLTMATAMSYIPMIFISPFAGALVDRWSRRRVMIVADGGIALATALLALLFATGQASLPVVFALLFIRATGSAFHWPAMSAATTLMVPKEHLSRIAGLNQGLHGAALLVSPVAGAFLIKVLPMQGVLAIDVVTALLAILPILFLRIPEPARGGEEAPQAVLAGFAEGFRFAIRWRGMLMLIGALTLMNLVVNPAFSLLPLYVQKILSGGAVTFGSLQAVFGAGIVLGGLLLTAWGGFKSRIVTALVSVGVMGFAIIALGLAPQGWTVLVGGALLVCGLMEPIANGSFVAAMQAAVPPAMQGRVFSLLSSATQIGTLIGLGLAGPMTGRFGLQIWFLIGGCAYLAVGFGSFLSRSIVNLEAEGERLRQESVGAVIQPALDE